MRKKETIIAIVGILFLLGVIVGVSLLVLFAKSNEPTKTDTKEKIKNEISLNAERKLQVCKNRNNCPNSYEDTYGTIETNIKNQVVLKKIQQLNQNMDQYYQTSKESSIEDPLCQNVKDIYNYRTHIASEYYLYASQDIVSISILSYQEDVCTGAKQYLPNETFVYDLKNNKELTTDDIKVKENVSDEVINGLITSQINQFNESMGINMSVIEVLQANSNPVLFYNADGEVFIWYYIPYFQKYYAASIDDNVA